LDSGVRRKTELAPTASSNWRKSGIEPILAPVHVRMMTGKIVMTATAIAMVALAASTPLMAEDDQKAAINGRCEYPERVARFRDDTTLIPCNTVTIERNATTATLDFKQRSWGTMARFTGDMPGERMTVAQITLRDGRRLAATGSCEIFQGGDGRLSVIACLAKAGSRSVAVNFVPSRL
jgi:hypothetical protein